MLNLLAEWLKKNVTVLLSKKLFAFLLSVLTLIQYKVNIVTVNLQCEDVPNLVQKYTPFPPPWECEPTKKDEKTITINFDSHPELFCRISQVIIGEKAHSCLLESKENVKKSNFVKSMFLEAWEHYEKHAWGYIGVEPVTNKPFGPKTSGDTILASMSTLWVMGLKEEFERGKRWIHRELDLEQGNNGFMLMYGVPNYIGGLLSCYALTGERMFVEKASDIAHMLQPAYKSRTGLPYDYINLTEAKASGSQILLSPIGAQLLEYIYLFNLTNDLSIEERIESVWKFVRKVEKPNGLYMEELNVETGKWTVNISTLWGRGKDLYLNLLKSYIQSGDQNMEALKLYSDAMEAVDRNGMIKVTGENRYYVTEYDVAGKNIVLKWSILGVSYTSCYLGAMYALGADAIDHSLTLTITEKSQVIVRHMQLARELTETCHQAAVNTKTGLAPMLFDFNNFGHTEFNVHGLSQELAESYFILWRLTHEQKYRDYAWEMVKAIHQHCRTESGSYSMIYDVHEIPTKKMDVYPVEFLSATLKYLYLTFTPDSVLPLDQWVFNSMGHPLPICGANDAYPKC